MMLQFLQVMTLVLSIIINGNLVFMSHGFYCYDRIPNKIPCVDYGLPIDSPFWISSGYRIDPDLYGCNPYRGFEVRCEGTKPVMNISNHRYYLQGMDPQTITLMDVDVDGEECPRPRHNFSLQSQPFLHYSGFLTTIFYNCTVAPQQQNQTSGTVSVGEIPCLENSYNNKTRRSYAFQTYYYDYNSAYAVPEGFHDWYNYCEESVAVPVEYYYTNATADLQRPFSLSWTEPVDCDDCESRGSGGQCSASGGGFSCQCKDGTTVENDICPEPEPEPQGIVYNLLLFKLVFFLMRKKSSVVVVV